MARISNVLGDGSAQAAIADITITYTTDDPGVTVNNALVIADGDLHTAPENHEAIEELVAKCNAICAALRATGIIQT